MRKSINRTTVVIVLAIFLTISVGYALFSDTITIEGTATAQGNFDIEATCMTNVTTDMLYEFGFEDSRDVTVAERFNSHGYKDESCIVNDDKVTYSVGLEYPTATRYQWIKMENNANIPTYFDFMDFLSQYIHNTIKKYDNQNNLLGTLNTTEDELSPFIYTAVGFVGKNVEGVYYNFLTNEDEFMTNFSFVNEETGDIKIILKPGETLYVPLVAIWQEDYDENNVKYEATGIFEFNWQQYTE